MTPKTVQEFYKRTYAIDAALNLKPKTWKEYERLYLAHVKPAFGALYLKVIRKSRIAKWHSRLAKATPYQANRALAVLSSILTLAESLELIENNPARGIKRAREPKRETYLSAKEREKIKELFTDPDSPLEPHEGAFLLFLLYTGARPGEAKDLCWEWMDDNGVFRLPDSKTGKRNLYAPQPALAALSAVSPPGTRSGRVFPENLDPSYIWRRVRKYTKIKARLYDLRHTFASQALSANLSLEVIGQLLGHTKADTTKRYAHLQTETGIEAVARTASMF